MQQYTSTNTNTNNTNIYQCPHCGIYIEIEKINCAIFRCGVYKSTGLQIPPHLSKEECDSILNIWGCSKPFLLNKENILEKCDYI